MKIIPGTKVVDKNDNVLGTVDHTMRNTLTGEITKFIVNRKAPERDLFLTLDDIQVIDDDKIVLNSSRV